MQTAASIAPLEPAAATTEGGDGTLEGRCLAATTTEVPRQRTSTRVARGQSRSARFALTRNRNAVELHRTSFLAAWSCIVVLHAICAAYLTQFARVCLFFAQPYMAYWTQLAAGDRGDHFWPAGVVIGVMSALHWWQLVCILWFSLQAGELVLLDRAFKIPIPHETARQLAEHLEKHTRRHRRVENPNRILPSTILVEHLSGMTIKYLLRLALWLWRFIFSRRGVFGIESNWFPVVYIIRELIEIVSQSFQARRSSELLPRLWLNNLLVALVVANCWSTPILQHLFHRRHKQYHQGLERVACLVLSAVLNMGSSILIPLIVFWPYYEAFLPKEFTFPPELLYNGLWFIRLAMEGQLLLSLSTADVLSKLIPHLGIFSALASAATLIQRKGSHRRSAVRTTVPAPSAESKLKLTNTTSPSSTALQAYGASRLRQHLMHILFFAWGFVLLVLHLRAVMRPQEPVMGCDQVTSPWFSTGYPCSMYMYNCYRQGIASPDEDSWSHIDEQSLLYLTMSHCPALKMPRRLQNFPNLIGVQLHNTTLVEWSKESAISVTKHTRMLSLVIARTNMTRIPEGLLEPLPAVLMDIEFSHTNLTTLPSNLHEKWHSITTLYVEHSLIREFPQTLLSLKILDLSLHGNLIEQPPELADLHQYFYSFIVSANPLRALPESIGEGTRFFSFSVENTLLETLPAWTQSSIDGTMYLYKTPYCKTVDAGGDHMQMNDGANLTCVARSSGFDGRVPLETIDMAIPL